MDTVRSESGLTVFGLVCAKMVAVNLLPFPHCAGGAALLELTGADWPRMKRLRPLFAIGGLVYLVCFVLWVCALFIYARS